MPENNDTVTTTASVVKTSFVRFFYPGMPDREDDVRKVSTRRARDIDIPLGAYAFHTFTRDVLTYTVEGVVKSAHGPIEDLSPMYYPGGTGYSLADLKSWEYPLEVLISNMESAGAKVAICTCYGDWVYVRDDSRIWLVPDERMER